MNCMAFINTLVSTPDDLQIRSELRREFVDMGILDIFASFKREYEMNELITQVGVFEEEMKVMFIFFVVSFIYVCNIFIHL